MNSFYRYVPIPSHTTPHYVTLFVSFPLYIAFSLYGAIDSARGLPAAPFYQRFHALGMRHASSCGR
jgi:hypothetical protein